MIETKLVVLAGPHSGLEHTIASARITLGRDSANTIPLIDDVTVSRFHAALDVRNSHYIISDLGGRNGIQVERTGEILQVEGTLPIQVGDQFCLGSTRIAVVSNDAQAPHVTPLQFVERPPIIELRVACEDDQLKYRFGDEVPLSKQYTIPYAADVVGGLTRRLHTLTKLLATQDVPANAVAGEELQEIGNALRRVVVPPRILERLEEYGGYPLLVTHDSELLEIPWELLTTQSGECWCDNFDLARQVVTEDLSVRRPVRNPSDRLRVLLVAAPTPDLEEITEDAEALLRMLRHSSWPMNIEYLAGPRVTQDALIRALDGADLVYYIGHGVYEPATSSAGWLLESGVFEAHNFRNLERPPRFAVSNACQSAREIGHHKTELAFSSSLGMASALMLAGVDHYLGTSWPLPATTACSFAHHFFTYLLEGHSLAGAVRRARHAERDLGGRRDASPASYVLFGSATRTLHSLQD